MTGMRRARLAGKPAIVAALVVATSVWALAGPLPAAEADRAAWTSLSRELAAPWPALQRRDGTFTDALRQDGKSRYGDAILGLGLLQNAARDRNRGQVRTALRALDATARLYEPWFPTRAFKRWAVASAYNLAKDRLRHLREVRTSMRRWARWLGHTRLDYIGRNGYENKHLVDALAVLELQRTGLRSKIEGSVIGDGRRRARSRVLRLINQAIPRMAAGKSGFVLSDPPSNPIAYHAFSFALYARAVRLLGPQASRSAHAVLRKLATTTGLLTAPDGSMAYWGRSQDQKWTMSAAAYGLALTSLQRASSAAADARNRAVAQRALSRMRAVGVGPRGEWLVQSLRQDFPRGLVSVDRYSRATEYTGLSLVFLNWATPHLPRRMIRAGIPADAPMQAVVGQQNGRFAVVSRGDLWYAVRMRPGSLRYDFGPMAVKRKRAGVWQDVAPLRPYANGTAGPILLGEGDRQRPVGELIKVDRAGRVLIAGGFATSSRWTRRGTAFRVLPTGCGLSLEAPAVAGDRMEFSAFFRGGVTPSVQGARATAAGQEVSFNVPIESTVVERNYASVSDARVTRARFIVRAEAPGALTMTTC